MKKLVYVAIACVAITFAACSGCNKSVIEAADSTAVDSLVDDTTAVDSAIVDTIDITAAADSVL